MVLWRAAFFAALWLGGVNESARGIGTFLDFQSQPGDYIGQGLTQNFSPIDGHFTARSNYDNGISLSFTGNDNWNLDFSAPGNVPLTLGTYTGAMRFPFQNAGSPGLSISGAGRGSNTLTGQFNVTNLVYGTGGTVQQFAASFEQHSEGATPALFGQVSFDTTTATATAAQIRNAIQLTSDQRNRLLPFASALGNAPTGIYMSSQAGDYIGQGQTIVLNNFSISGTVTSGVHINYSGAPGVFWSLDFTPPSGLGLISGDYGSATRYPFNSPTKPGLNISGNGRGSNTLTGDFEVLDSSFGPTGNIQSLDLLFEQHSEGAQPALFGLVRYNETAVPEPAPIMEVALAMTIFGGFARRRPFSRRS